ncbi:DUF3017 domain-containing protein [Streptomyces sp. NPDC008121]|uniref:DUF3017 domain-containing protein n=1 Tax=Streptomyces sp. NPDC008121 TaxID=3364809 RepID=UPI0036ED6EA3
MTAARTPAPDGPPASARDEAPDRPEAPPAGRAPAADGPAPAAAGGEKPAAPEAAEPAGPAGGTETPGPEAQETAGPAKGTKPSTPEAQKPAGPAGGTEKAAPEATEPAGPAGPEAAETEGTAGATAGGGDQTTAGAEGTAAGGRTRRPPAMTTDTARPEGGGRAAPGDAPAPARQWPLLTVLGLAALGLLVVGTELFPQSSRIGTILVGAALLTGAALRRALPSVGMLAVRSRFTDMVTYGLMGTLIVLLALMVQPGPWLKIPFLEDILHLTIT